MSFFFYTVFCNSWNVNNIGMVYNNICNFPCEAKPALDLFGILGLYFFDA